MNVGQITTFRERSKSFQESELKGNHPIGTVDLIDNFLTNPSYKLIQYIPCFIYYKEFEEHFCTEKEYRKLKLEKINESR
jgi:hypothetical protein